MSSLLGSNPESGKLDRCDVLIVGGGAAGLSAALVLGRARRRVVVVDSGEPRNKPAAHMHGFLSRDGLPPVELLSLGRAEIAGYGVEVVRDQVVTVRDRFDVILSDGTVITARSLLIATGVADGLPDIAGLEGRWGRDVLHCPYCHGWEVRGQPLGVLATSSGSVQFALLIRQWSDDVVFFSQGQPLSDGERAQLRARRIAIVTERVERAVVADNRLIGVDVEDGSHVSRSALFVRTANMPRADGLLASVGCELGEAGFPKVDPSGRTTIPGVWAAGNIVDPRLSVIAAAGAAAMTAMDINANLVESDATLASIDRT